MLHFAVLHAGDDVANAGAAFSKSAETAGVGQDSFEELQRNHVLALELDRGNAGHANAFQHAKVSQVVVRERHPKAHPLGRGEVFGEAFQFLMIEQIHLLRSYPWEVERRSQRNRIGFLPSAVFPEAALCGDFANIDFRVEVGRKGQAVATGIAVHNVQRFDTVEMMLRRVGTENVGHAWVKPGSKKRREAGFLESLLIGPLPVVFEFWHVARFIVGGVHVIHSRFEAGIHQRQVLVGQGDIDQDVRLEFLEQLDGRWHVVGIDGRGADRHAFFLQNVSGDGIATGLRAAGQHDFAKDILRELSALVSHDTSNAAGADDKGLFHKKMMR